MSAMFLLQFAIVLLCIFVGARVGGIGLGVFGGLGLAILSFGFGLKPAGLPIDVMFMIMAVVAAAAAMQAALPVDESSTRPIITMAFFKSAMSAFGITTFSPITGISVES